MDAKTNNLLKGISKNPNNHSRHCERSEAISINMPLAADRHTAFAMTKRVFRDALKIYHNPRCKKSREGLIYLESKTKDFAIVEYLKTGITKEILKEILLKSNLKIVELVRTQEDIFKKELRGKKFNDDEWFNIIIENPTLLQRPIVVGKHKAVFAQPAEEINKILKAGNDPL